MSCCNLPDVLKRLVISYLPCDDIVKFDDNMIASVLPLINDHQHLFEYVTENNYLNVLKLLIKKKIYIRLIQVLIIITHLEWHVKMAT